MVIVISIFGALTFLSIIAFIRNSIKEKEVRESIVFPENFSHLMKKKQEEEDAKSNKEKKKRKPFILKRIYDEYLFYYKKANGIFIVAFLGYSLSVLLFYFVSRNITFSFILALTFLAIEYIFIDDRITSANKKYTKNFANAIQVISTSLEAGDTLPKAITNVVNRNTISERIREEFEYVNIDLKNNLPLEEAFEHLYERNKGVKEITMFVTIIQFYSKKGGSGLKDMLAQLGNSLNAKVSNYAEIDAEIGLYKMLMNFFIYGFFLALVLVPFFMPTFYISLMDQGLLGYLKIAGSILFYFVGIVMYKRIISDSAKG